MSTVFLQEIPPRSTTDSRSDGKIIKLLLQHEILFHFQHVSVIITSSVCDSLKRFFLFNVASCNGAFQVFTQECSQLVSHAVYSLKTAMSLARVFISFIYRHLFVNSRVLCTEKYSQKTHLGAMKHSPG